MNLAPRRRQSPRVGSLQEIIINSAEEPQPTTTHANEARKKGEKKTVREQWKTKKIAGGFCKSSKKGRKHGPKKPKAAAAAADEEDDEEGKKKTWEFLEGRKQSGEWQATERERERERKRTYIVQYFYITSTS